MTILTTIVTNDLLVAASSNMAYLNIWDALFTLFANGYLLFFCLTPLWIYLCGDLVVESLFDEHLLLRLQSRHQWWLSKLLTLAIIGIVYLLSLVGIALAVISFVLPWSWHWSANAMQYPEERYLHSGIMTVMPMTAFGFTLLLLLLGWLGMSLAIIVGTYAGKSVKWGLLIGITLNLNAVIMQHVSLPTPYATMVINKHMLINQQIAPTQTLSILSVLPSFCYWGSWLSVLTIVGWRLCIKRDYLRYE
jgi:hypothetical protein